MLTFLIFVFSVLVCLALIAGILYVSGLVICSAVAFSKVTFSLAVAAILNTNNPILEGGGFWSFVVWAAIVFAAVFLLCRMPRVNCGFTFFCYAIVASLVGWVVVGLACTMFSALAPHETVALVIVRIGSLVLAAGQMFAAHEDGPKELFGNRFLINVERAIASLMYGFGVWFVFFTNVKQSGLVSLLIWFGFAAIAFAIDWFFNKDDLEIPTIVPDPADVLVGEIVEVLN